MVPNVDRNIKQLLNNANVCNSIYLFFIVVLTVRIHTKIDKFIF
jgi:hypothetical protein